MDKHYQKRNESTDRLESRQGYFWWKIFEFLKIKEKFGGFVGETKSNPWQPCSDTIWCSTGLLGWPDLHGLTEDVDERTQEHEEHQEERPEHKNTHTIQEPFPLPVGPTGPIESTRRWRDWQVGILDGCFSNGQPSRSNKVTRG